MLGSSASIACTNYILNTIVAEALSDFADELEKATDFHGALTELVASNYKKHKRIIYNGNSYSSEWVSEAEHRGLLNLKSTVDALPRFLDPKNVKLLEKHAVLNRGEIASRMEILLEAYSKTINIEALTMLEMAKKQILPAVLDYESKMVKLALNKKNLCPDIDASVEKDLIYKLSNGAKAIYGAIERLESDVECPLKGSALEVAEYYHDVVLSDMSMLRSASDALEVIIDKSDWPFPTYADILYSVK